MSSDPLSSARRKPRKKRHRGKKHEGKAHKPKKPKKKPKPKPTPAPKPPTPPKPKPKPAPASPYAPGSYPATAVLATAARHLANRFSYGVTPALAAEVRAAGSHLAWFDQQLEASYDDAAEPWADWWPDLHLGAAEIYQRQVDKIRNTSNVGQDMARRTMMRRIASPYQVLEVMTEFWENHLHVPASVDNIGVYRHAYGEVVRAGALGRFADLLPAAVLHPAMLMYLGNVSSTKKQPNENLGRELLELHTVGVGHHTEDDVKSSARILTGWRARTFSTWEPYYSATDHWTGAVAVKEFSDPNTATDGRDLTLRYLDFLAHHPDTARRIAGKLVRQFVSDDPATGLVDRLAAVYLAQDTAIRPVLQALVRSTEFAASVDRRLRDGDEDVAASYRLLGAVPTAPVDGNSAANQLYSQVSGLGLAPFGWPRPDGQPVDNRSWASATRAIASMSLHWNMAGRSFPKKDVTWTLPADLVPVDKMLLRDLVDHLSRLWLHRPSTAELLRSCCVATDWTPTTEVSTTARGFSSTWTKLAAAILDSPAFYQH